VLTTARRSSSRRLRRPPIRRIGSELPTRLPRPSRSQLTLQIQRISLDRACLTWLRLRTPPSLSYPCTASRTHLTHTSRGLRGPDHLTRRWIARATRIAFNTTRLCRLSRARVGQANPSFNRSFRGSRGPSTIKNRPWLLTRSCSRSSLQLVWHLQNLSLKVLDSDLTSPSCMLWSKRWIIDARSGSRSTRRS
jgi:hypothetical protein